MPKPSLETTWLAVLPRWAGWQSSVICWLTLAIHFSLFKEKSNLCFPPRAWSMMYKNMCCSITARLNEACLKLVKCWKIVDIMSQPDIWFIATLQNVLLDLWIYTADDPAITSSIKISEPVLEAAMQPQTWHYLLSDWCFTSCVLDHDQILSFSKLWYFHLFGWG